MSEEAEIESTIVRFFDDQTPQAALKKKEIIDHVKSQHAFATKKTQVKKILTKLEKSEQITLVSGEKKKYIKAPVVKVSHNTDVTTKSDQQDGSSGKTPLPIAEMLRQKKASRKRVGGAVTEKATDKEDVDIDEEIRRLEAELNEENSDGESSEGQSDDEDASSKEQNDAASGGDGVLCLSSVAKDRISPLPQNYLPTAKSKPMKIDRSQVGEPKPKRQKTKAAGANDGASEGLKAAVKSVLDGYVARSNERLPYYCRVCAKQYNNDEEFFQHKKTDFHKAAVEMERKASYCKLCRKQLTSPVQLKEHLKSRPHKNRLEMLRTRQQKGRR